MILITLYLCKRISLFLGNAHYSTYEQRTSGLLFTFIYSSEKNVKKERGKGSKILTVGNLGKG